MFVRKTFRYSASTECGVRRLTTLDGAIKLEFAMGRWDERRTLDYHPVNAPYNYKGTLYDSYGRPEGDAHYGSRKHAPDIYQIAEHAGAGSVPDPVPVPETAYAVRYHRGADGRLNAVEYNNFRAEYAYVPGANAIAQLRWSKNGVPFLTLNYERRTVPFMRRTVPFMVTK